VAIDHVVVLHPLAAWLHENGVMGNFDFRAALVRNGRLCRGLPVRFWTLGVVTPYITSSRMQ
jgi:hypothetical protein